jgi:hypothetical protein
MGTFHGITSLALLALAMLVGLIGLAPVSPAAAAGYMLLLGLSFVVVCGAFCAKCPCRASACGHLLPGLVAQRLPARPQTAYTAADLALTAAALAAMVLFPQPWLWPRPMLLALFWSLVALAALQIAMRVCRRCRNNHCPMQRGIGRIRSWKEDRPAD